MDLVSFPCDRELIPSFLKKLPQSSKAALILQKQEPALRPILLEHGITEIYSISEDMYGRVTSDVTKRILTKIAGQTFRTGFFPINDFCGNIALFLATVVKNVVAVNATSLESVELALPVETLAWANGETLERAKIQEIQALIVDRLRNASSRLAEIEQGDRAGEKPTSGLVNDAPYDCEVLSRYMVASQAVHGKVLEIGCGLGFGAYFMVKLNPNIQVCGMDNDPEAIGIARELWGDEPRLSFELVDAEHSAFQNGSFDSIVCFEVIEHVTNPRELMEEACRLLAPGGPFVGSTPNSSLYPYRVNHGGTGTPDELRRDGVWPWHIQEFDESKISQLMGQFQFQNLSFTYPTFTTGLQAYNEMLTQSCEEKVNTLAQVKWSTADFQALDTFYPCFSGSSFMYTGKRAAVV